MAAPTVSSIVPSNGSTNVGINQVVKVTFSEALLTSSVGTHTFVITHRASGMVMGATVAKDPANGAIVLITPNTLLFKNSTFEVKIIGADASAPAGAVKSSSDSSNLALTYKATFTTGDDIDVETPDKSNADEAKEGQLDLPVGIFVGPSANFKLISTIPPSLDGKWGFTGDRFTLVFNRNVENRSITGNITVRQLPFLDQAGWFAKSGTFEWQMTGGSYTVPTWTMYQSGATVVLNIQEADANVFKNVRYEVEVANITDTTGNLLQTDEMLTFTSQSYPNYFTPRTVRNEVAAVFDSLRLDYVHELVWKHSIDAFKLAGWSPEQFTSDGRHLFNYVKASTALSILRDLMLQKTIMAGITKTLGDMTIAYHPNAGTTKDSPIISYYEDLLRKAERAIGYRSHTARVFIRGWDSEFEPLSYRNRLWKNPRIDSNTDGNSIPSQLPGANTTEERDAKGPGAYDLWS